MKQIDQAHERAAQGIAELDGVRRTEWEGLDAKRRASYVAQSVAAGKRIETAWEDFRARVAAEESPDA